MPEVIPDTHIHLWGKQTNIIPSKPKIGIIKRIINKLRRENVK